MYRILPKTEMRPILVITTQTLFFDLITHATGGLIIAPKLSPKATPEIAFAEG